MSLKFFLCVMIGLGSGVASAKVLETKRAAKLLSEPDRKSSVLSKLKKGAVLESLGRKGMFWKAKYEEKEGYISVMKVKRKSTGKSGLADVIRAATKENRENSDSARVRSRSAVMGVRGLDESSSLAQIGNLKPDLRAVYRMEDRSVDQDQTVEKYGAVVDKEINYWLENQ